MAHELNQRLAAILINAQAAQLLLARIPPDLEETRAIMTDIVSDDLRAGEVIQRLRSLLKRDETKPERLDLSKLTGEVLELARSELVTQRVRSEERRVGKECDSTCRSRGSAFHAKKNNRRTHMKRTT